MEQTKAGIVIITYNRPDDMLDLARNIAALDAGSDVLSEVIIVNNRSTVSYEKLERFISEVPHIPFRYILADENLGVSRGRNFAIRACKADVMIFIDDDALFENKDAVKNIVSIFDQYHSDRPLGILSLKVLYESTHDFQVNAFPHKKFREKKDLHEFDTYYFTGCAHAIHRKVFEHAGLYPENFFYGMEEYDLGYRTLDEGFSIRYNDAAVVLHKESPLGRLQPKEKIRQMWVNKCRIAWKYLPKRYFYSTAFMWTFQYLLKTGFNIPGVFKGWRAISGIPEEEKRSPVSKECMEYLDRVDARLAY